jgi:putative copper export protein
MLTSETILSLSYFLHLIATVAWIGGLVTLALVVQPVLNRTVAEVQERARLLEDILKRFQPIANLSLAVLILTGMVQTFTNRFYKGFLSFDNLWAQAILLKHIAVLGMIIVAAFITFSVQPALKRNALLIANGLADELQIGRLQQQQVRLTRINLLLSVLVLLFTAIASSQA